MSVFDDRTSVVVLLNEGKISEINAVINEIKINREAKLTIFRRKKKGAATHCQEILGVTVILSMEATGLFTRRYVR